MNCLDHSLAVFHNFPEKEIHSSFSSLSCAVEVEFLRGNRGGCGRVLTFQISTFQRDFEQNRKDFFQFT